MKKKIKDLTLEETENQSKLKALEIIKKLDFEFEYRKSTNSYLLHIANSLTWHLTQEEYDLLKEVLL